MPKWMCNLIYAPARRLGGLSVNTACLITHTSEGLSLHGAC